MDSVGSTSSSHLCVSPCASPVSAAGELALVVARRKLERLLPAHDVRRLRLVVGDEGRRRRDLHLHDRKLCACKSEREST